MNVLDIALGVLILFGLVRGLMKGFFVEIASIVALIVGIYGAIYFSDFVAELLESSVKWDIQYINISAFAITFIIIVIVIAMAGRALTKLADFASLGILNKILGGIFGTLKVGLILSIVLIVFNKMNSTIPLVEEHEIKNSILYIPVKSIAPLIFPSIINEEETDK